MNQENILRILGEIEISISKIKNELETKEKYEKLINKIKSIDDLKYLFNENDECREHIFECIGKANKYPLLNEYIDLYFKFNPDKVNEQNKLGQTPFMFSSKHNIETRKIKVRSVLLMIIIVLLI